MFTMRPEPPPPQPQDQATTAPLSALVTVHQQARDELIRTDSKATTLLSVMSLALAGVIALTGRPVPMAAGLTLAAAGLAFGAAALVLLAVIRPRLLAPTMVPGSWLHATQATPAALLAGCQLADTAQRLAEDTCTLAQLAATKYRYIRRAITLLTAGLLLLAVTLLLAVVLP